MSAGVTPAGRFRLDWLLHETFQLSILAKGAFALLEAIAGLSLWLIGPNAILALVTRATHAELGEDPADWIARTLLHWAQGFSIETQHFYALYLLAHGLVKVVMVAALLKGYRWAYPAALGVMAMFVAYQLYRFSITHGPGLILLTIFDLFVIALIWREWRARPAAS